MIAKVEKFNNNKWIVLTPDKTESPRFVKFIEDLRHLMNQPRITKSTLDLSSMFVRPLQDYEHKETYMAARLQSNDYTNTVQGFDPLTALVMSTNEKLDPWNRIDLAFWTRIEPKINGQYLQKEDFGTYFDGQKVAVVPLNRDANQIMAGYVGKKMLVKNMRNFDNISYVLHY